MKLAIPLLLVTFAIPAAGCEGLFGGSCTAADCIDSLSVTLTDPDGAWPIGSYAITVDVTGSPVTFACSVAEPINESGCDRPADAPATLSVEPAFQDGKVVSFVVQSEAAPTKVPLEVARDGTPVLARTLSPHYSHGFPNGTNCPPGCRIGDGEVEL
ncbi:MAG: hypothetical protein U1F43_27365 [Myxococcota bacterium]